jgi:nucleoid-associated protein YgaU
VKDPVQMLIEAGAVPASTFPPNSRHHGANVLRLERKPGETIAFLARRFVPQPGRFSTMQEHTVVQGDRLDLIAAKYLGDPELYWRLCDANGALRPDDLIEEIGRRLRITQAAGMPGTQP